MAFSLRITDWAGHTKIRNLSAETRAEAWGAYAILWDDYAIQAAELRYNATGELWRFNRNWAIGTA